MALNINGRMKVKTLRADFKEEFGLTLRVYDGRSFADDDATLASIRKGDSKGGEFAPRKNTKVGNLEDKILELFGIKTQVAGSDDSYLCDNDLTLAGALEADEKKMAKKVKKAENKMEANDDAVVAETESTEETTELTDEEKTWLDDLYNLDEAPETIRASKAFMLEAVKEGGTYLEYASDALKGDKDVVLLAVKDNGGALEYASDELKNDKEIVLQAVKNDGYVLEYASDALKDDKEIALLAIRDDAAALEYASDTIKKDSQLAFEIIKSLNEKNEDPDSYRKDFGNLQYFSPNVFNDELVIDEMIRFTPFEFIDRLLNAGDEKKFEVLKSFNQKISKSLKNEVEEDINKVLNIAVEANKSIEDRRLLVEEVIGYGHFGYNSGNLGRLNMNYELVREERNRYFYDEENEGLELYDQIDEILTDKVIAPLKEEAASLDDFSNLLQLTCPQDEHYKGLMRSFELTESLFNALEDYIDEADAYSLFSIYLHEDSGYRIEESLPAVAENIMNSIGEKLLDMEIGDALAEMDEYKVCFLSSEVKSQLLEKIEDGLNEEDQEDYQGVIDSLSEDVDDEY